MKQLKPFFIKLVALLALLVFFVWANSYALESDTVKNLVQSFGYPGVFFIAVLSGFNLAIPIPAIGFYPLFMELGYASWMVIGVISFGMLVGDAIGYLIGSAGKDALSDTKAVKYVTLLDSLHKKHPLLPYACLLIYAAVVPLPNELIVIPMAFAGYRFLPMGAMLFVGNIIFNVLGAIGIVSLVSLF